MFRLIGSSCVGVLIVTCQLFAQPATAPHRIRSWFPDRTDPAGLVEQRVSFIRKAYSLSEAQAGTLREALTARIPKQRQYDDRVELTVCRIETAMAILPDQPDLPYEMQKTLRAKFEGQLQKYRENAPLSLLRCIQAAEKSMSPEQITAGRQRLAEQYGGKTGDKEFDINAIDTLAFGPPRPAKLPSFTSLGRSAFAESRESEPPVTVKAPPAQASPPTPTAAKKEAPEKTPTDIKPQPAPKQAAPSRAVTPPTKPDKPLPPAPPVEQWPKEYEKIAAKYMFSTKQKEIAKSLVNSYCARATSHIEKNKAAYEAAKGGSDAEKKAQLDNLNRPLNKMFDQMVQRIDAIATMEQKLGSQAKGGQPK